MDITSDNRALALHQEALVFDGLAISYVLDEKFTQRCLEGGVSAANVTFALEENWDKTLNNFERYLAKIDRSPLLALCRTADEVVAAKKKGRLGIVIGTQGASMIQAGEEFWRLDTMVRMGLRFLGLAYTTANALGDGCGEKRDAGLTYLGEELIQRANELPIMIDLSHCGHRTRAEAAAIARAPVCTHSNSDAVRSNGRNTTDSTAQAMAAKGGVIGVCGLPQSLSDTTPTLEDLLTHLDHFVKLVGVQHVGIGMDYVEAYQEQASVVAPPSVVYWRTRRPDIFGSLASFGRQSYPTGVDSVRKLPNLTHALLLRGYTPAQVQSLLGGSWLEAMRRFCG